MSLSKIHSSPLVLIEDDSSDNVLPIILEITPSDTHVHLFCYEQPISVWKCVFHQYYHVIYHEAFIIDNYNKIIDNTCTVIIDSINQMSLCLGWNQTLKCIKKLHSDPNVERLILILHKDCLTHSSRLSLNLRHMASTIITFDSHNPCKIWLQIKKGSKMVKSEEMLSYDYKTTTLKSVPVLNENENKIEAEKPIPSNLSTFKIEVDQTDKLEKYKLKLPYMSKIREGESKVYYEPDAVDDWDEEDPDEDLDI